MKMYWITFLIVIFSNRCITLKDYSFIQETFIINQIDDELILFRYDEGFRYGSDTTTIKKNDTLTFFLDGLASNPQELEVPPLGIFGIMGLDSIIVTYRNINKVYNGPTILSEEPCPQEKSLFCIDSYHHEKLHDVYIRSTYIIKAEDFQ